ncbi:MAG: lysostaphin resistance A-like protein [Planctomycetota bacterium]|jgi:membrane protease YdiL (CAAX protease family)
MTDELALKIYVVLFVFSLIAWVLAGVQLARKRPLLPAAPPTPGRWKARHSMAALALYIVAMFAAALVLKPFYGLEATANSIAATFALLYVFSVPTLLVIHARAGRGGSLRESLGLGGTSTPGSLRAGARYYLLFFPLQALYLLVLVLLWRKVTGGDPPTQPGAEALLEADVFVFAWLSLVAVVIAPAVEELVFRGFIQKGLENSIGENGAVVATALLFAVVHGAGFALQLLPVSFALCFIYRRTRNLAICIGFHSALNLVGVLAALAFRISSS